MESNEVDPAATSKPNIECLSSVTLIVPLVVFVAITILLTVIIIVMCKRKKNEAGKTIKNSYSPAKYSK